MKKRIRLADSSPETRNLSYLGYSIEMGSTSTEIVGLPDHSSANLADNTINGLLLIIAVLIS
jgi:hypothetical protein